MKKITIRHQVSILTRRQIGKVVRDPVWWKANLQIKDSVKGWIFNTVSIPVHVGVVRIRKWDDERD